VAYHEDVGTAPRQHRAEPSVLPVVRDQKARAGDFDLEELRQCQQSWTMVVVAAYGVHRGDLAQPVEEGFVDGVAREQDAVDTVEDLRKQRIEPAVQVGDQPQPDATTA
jgi:hypothetical protein